MVDQDLINTMEKDRRPWNRQICEGLAVSEMSQIPEILHQVINCGLDRAIPGLVYKGYKRTDPREHLAEIIRPRNSKHLLEQTHSNMVMYRYEFEFNGEKIPVRYQSIPYADAGGLVTLRDTKYVASPTMTDRFYSIEKGSIFVPYTRLRVTFKREPYFFYANREERTADTHWSRIHYVAKGDAATNRYPQIFNYIMCWMGATEAFKYFGYDVIFGDADTLNEADFPRDEWIICSSTGQRPRFRIANFTVPTTQVAIKKSQYDRTFESLAASFFYVLDNCADFTFMTPDNMENIQIWKRALCRFIWRNPNPVETIAELDNHLLALEDYLDDIILRKLQAEQVFVDDIRGHFRHIVKDFSKMVLENDPAAVIGKRISVSQQVTFSAVRMINTVMYTLTRIPEERRNYNTVRDIFYRQWKSLCFMGLSSPNHPEVTVAESATDCLPYKLTGIMCRPSRTSNSQGGQSHDPISIMHPDFIRVHSARMVTKAAYTASGRINPNVLLTPTGLVAEDPALTPFAEEFAKLR